MPSHFPEHALRLRRPLLICALLGLPASSAFAHAILVQSDPPAGAAVPAGKVDLHLRYNSRIDSGRSRLTLIAPDHAQTVLPIGAAATEDVLNTTATLAPGAYTVRWQVLAVDGHITRGDLPFTVTGP
jgi:methionine-rich copper-binding protein CopC